MNGNKLAVIGVVALLLVGGGGFGVYSMKMSAPSYRALPLTTAGQQKERCKEWADKLEAIAQREEFLVWVVEQSDYASLMGLAEGDAVNDLSKRIQIRYRQQSDRIEIGVKGKRKEDDQLNKVAKVIHSACIGTLAKADSDFGAYIQSLSGN